MDNYTVSRAVADYTYALFQNAVRDFRKTGSKVDSDKMSYLAYKCEKDILLLRRNHGCIR